MKTEQDAFSERLRVLLRQAGMSESPAELVRLLARFGGEPVAQLHELHKQARVFLEINTQPGMTSTSLVPELAAHNGLSYPAFVALLVEDAGLGR